MRIGNVACLTSLTLLLGIALGCEEFSRASGDDDFAGSDAGDSADDDDDNGGGSDSNTDTDMDADSDGYPPEQEEEADYKVPQGSGRYVFIVDEMNDAVVVVDSNTLAIKVIDVGKRPTHMVALSDDNAVAVLNLDSDEMTIIRVDDDGAITTYNLKVRPDTNALAASPDGRWVIAFYDPKFAEESGIPQTDQEISIAYTVEGEERVIDLSVGRHPWQVRFDAESTRAFVITEAGINIVNLDEVDEIQMPTVVNVFEPGTFAPSDVDIAIPPDGSIALGRRNGSKEVVAAWLDDSGKSRTYVLPDDPTDLDIASNGSFGVFVIRGVSPADTQARRLYQGSDTDSETDSETDTNTDTGSDTDSDTETEESTVAFFNLPLPADENDDPFTYVDVGGPIVGVSSLTPDDRKLLLYTTTAGDESDQRRLTVLLNVDAKWRLSGSVLLDRKIKAVAPGANSSTAVVIHQSIVPGENEQAYAYSLVSIPDLMHVKLHQAPEEPGRLLLTPDGDRGFFLLETNKTVEICNLDNFIVNHLSLGSPPIAAGYVSDPTQDIEKVFIAQDHPAGRMTFIDINADSVRTITGYTLNDQITN